MDPDPETPCVCTHSTRGHGGPAGRGCHAMIRVGGLVLAEGNGLVPGVVLVPCPCTRLFVEEA